jgi:hypothetical protein
MKEPDRDSDPAGKVKRDGAALAEAAAPAPCAHAQSYAPKRTATTVVTDGLESKAKVNTDVLTDDPGTYSDIF